MKGIGYILFLSAAAALGGFLFGLRHGRNLGDHFDGHHPIRAQRDAPGLVRRVRPRGFDRGCVVRRNAFRPFRPENLALAGGAVLHGLGRRLRRLGRHHATDRLPHHRGRRYRRGLDHLAHVYQRDRRRQTPGTPRVALPAGHHHRLPRSLHRQLRPAELCRTGYADGHALEQGLHHRAVARHAGRRDPPGTALPRDPLLHPREPGDGSSPGAGPTAPSPSRRASAAARPTPAANWAKPSSGSNATKARNGNSCCARTC